jgi:ACR3 family arsenite efflux pump ArsB
MDIQQPDLFKVGAGSTKYTRTTSDKDETAIALVAFPEQPLIALILVIGPLIELPILALVSQVLLLIRHSNMYPVGRG